jgi:putative nucleotidyltransferase with HDIG domain
MTASNGPSATDYVTAEQLCIGLFVILDLPWFKHSFALSSFKIRTDAQLSELKALRLPRYRYDPARSDNPPQSASAQDAAPTKSTAESKPEPAAAAPIAMSPERLARWQAQQERRENIEQIEKAFAKAGTVMKNMYRNIYAKPKETLDEMGGLVGDMVDAFLLSPEATLHVMSEKAGGEDVYFHSLNVTILAMMLAKEMGFSPQQARDMGVGGLLHDIGLLDIPDRIAKKTQADLTQPEWNLRVTHVDHGVKLGQRIALPPGAVAVIAQHHELVDGTGYPARLKGPAIDAGARLISLVNFYDNLCNPPDVNKAMTPHEALSFMFAQCRAKFDSQALQLLIRSLGVHPPGSVVQLSNQALAVVTSVNPKKPLRPWVCVYDENVPKEEAPSINLELVPDLSIIKSIRPAQLAPKVAAYLNLRKRVTYFFDPGATGADGATTP